MTLLTRLKAIQPIILVLLIAILLRAWAVSLLPQDFDEPVYLQAGFDYAGFLRAGDLNALIDYQGVTEHPALVKLLYSTGILALGDQADWQTAFYVSRSISALFGVLAVAFLAFALDPLAAGMLAVHTLAIKYGSQVYLEAVPHAMTLGAVLAFLRTDGNKFDRWLGLSALGLGLAAASKYSYLPVAVLVLGYIALIDKRTKAWLLLGYAAISLATFLAADISLWHDPLHRLIDSLTFHVRYSQGAHVQESAYPWFQPLIWILTSSPAHWHPEVFFYFGFDAPITLLALAGIRREYRERRWLVVWLLAGMLFLFLWPTKWPQYALTVTPPLCIMGAETLRRAVRWVRETDAYWKYLGGMFPNPGKWFWISLGGFGLFIAAIYLSAAIQLAAGKIGWTYLSTGNSGLPSNAVHDIVPLDDGRILIITDHGAAIWIPPGDADSDPQWSYIGPETLGSSIALSAIQDQEGDLWIGTASGLVAIQAADRIVFHAAELGLNDDRVISLLQTDDGRIFAGTLSGVSMWNGIRWTPLEEMAGRPAFALAWDGAFLWIGTSDGVERWEPASQEWTFYPTASPVSHVAPASSGRLWIGTSGSGLASLDDGTLTYYTVSNSDIPHNNITWIEEVKPGLLWIGASRSTTVGGAVASFDGTDWHVYMASNSGASGGEPLVISVIAGQSIWIGTRTEGIDIYQIGSGK